MTENMIERVARALFESEKTRYFYDGSPITWDAAVANFHKGRLTRCRRAAKAAIEAMREPTDAIVRAHHVVPDDTDFRERAADNWRNLIDSALKD